MVQLMVAVSSKYRHWALVTRMVIILNSVFICGCGLYGSQFRRLPVVAAPVSRTENLLLYIFFT